MNSNLEFWADFFSAIGWFGAFMVIFGVVLEAAELLIKWGKKEKFRVWVSDIFLTERKRTLVWLVRHIKPRILPYETVGFILLFFGLAIELIGSGTAERLQSQINSHLNEVNTQLQIKLASLNAATIELAHQYDLSTNALVEAKARIGALSSAVALNSPSNFPISTVSAFGYVIINKNDASKVVELEHSPAILELIAEDPTNSVLRPMMNGGTIVNGEIIGSSTNQLGILELSFSFEDSNVLRVGGTHVTFKNLKYARLDICPSGPLTIVRVEHGHLSVRLNSNSAFDFSAEFKFPPQTNNAISIMAIRNNGFW